jgi:hypothetical protein
MVKKFSDYKLRQIKKAPAKFEVTELKQYLQQKKVTGVSSLRKNQLVKVITNLSAKKPKNVKVTKKEHINKIISSYQTVNRELKNKPAQQVKQMVKSNKQFQNKFNKDVAAFAKIDARMKQAELQKYIKLLSRMHRNNSINSTWTRINKPIINSWNEVLLLLPRIVTDEDDMLFIGKQPGQVFWVITVNNKHEFRNQVDSVAEERHHNEHRRRDMKNRDDGTRNSDEELEEVITEREYVYVNLVSRALLEERKQKKRAKNMFKRKVKGGFFKHFHNLPIDLSRYQIYRKDQIETVNYEPCLIHCLRMAGIKGHSVTRAKRFIKVDFVDLKDIKKLSEKINVGIKIFDSDKRKYYHYNTEAKTQITINLQNEHYFVDDNETNITSYALDNYEALKDEEDFNKIIGVNNKGYYKRSEDRYVNSNKLVKFLLDNEDTYLTDILDDLDIKLNKIKNDDDFVTEVDDNDCRENEYKERKSLDDLELVFFDFETTTDEEIHKPFLVNAEKHKLVDGKYVMTKNRSFKGPKCGLKFLQWISNNSVLLAHNVKYDYQFIMKYLFGVTLTERNNKIMGGTVKFHNIHTKKNHTLLIRDTYLMISQKLNKFPEMFFTEQECKEIKKEIMPYGVYNKNTVKKEQIPVKDALAELSKKNYGDKTYYGDKKSRKKYIENSIKEKKKEFLQNIKKWNLVNGKYYDHMRYAEIYCKQDVKVMAKGYLIFRDWLKEITGLDIVRYLTISSIADDYVKKEGGYEGCYQFSGVIRKYLQGFVVGGRCMIRDNEKTICDEEVQDFDAVGLYASAMVVMGFLKGKVKVIEDKNYDIIKNYDGYFIKINITKVGKDRHFPLINKIDDSSIRQFKNELIGIHKVDKVTLEDLIKYQQIEFEVIEGYYFNEGRNYKINDIIKKLFNERKEQKKKGNKIQEVYKLLMNSCYGKTILKEQDTRVIYKDTEDDAIKYIMRNADNIREFNKIDDSNKYRIKVLETTDDMYTSPHIGSEILSMSKRIMNDVMCLAEELRIIIMYQDTDSMHIHAKDIERLSVEYQKRFNRPLIGKDLGQFHNDFEVGQDKGTEPVAIKTIVCAKKVYMDKLKCIVKGKEEIRFHVRCKGIPRDSLDKVCDDKYDGDYVKLYEDIYNGKPIEFDLLTTGVKFKFNKDYTITNITDFKRKLELK